jgi:hypothetical protein
LSDKTSFRVSKKLFSRSSSIQQAIDEAPIGSVIEIDPGVYKEDIVIDKYIELVGVGKRENIILQGVKSSSITMKKGYAVIRNVTLKQPKEYGLDRGMDTVYIENGTLLMDSCSVISGKGPGVTIDGDTAEPIIRHCELISHKNSAAIIKGKGNVVFDRCRFLSYAKGSPIIHILEGKPHFKKCTIVGTNSTSCGIFVQKDGNGKFEDCDIYGFDHEAAIYLWESSASFYRCKIHDGKHCGIIIRDGNGKFEDCSIFSFEKDAPAIRVTGKSAPLFYKTAIHNCKGGGIIFEKGGGGFIDKCQLYGFIFRPAIRIFEDAHPSILRSTIHDGNVEGIVSTSEGKGVIRDCELYSFTSYPIAAMNGAELDVLNCKLSGGNTHGLYYSQRSTGMVQDCQLSKFKNAAAIHVSKAANPSIINCQIYDSYQGVEVVDHGRGKFERCVFWEIEQDSVWEIHESNPEIFLCKEMSKDKGQYVIKDSAYSDELLISNPKVGKIFEQVEQLVGQWKVKAKLREVVHYLDYLEDRKRLGVKLMDEAKIHGLFFGPPETGKEEMAKFYAQMLKEIGVIETDRLVKISHHEFTGPDPLMKERRLKERLEKSIGGVLYVDSIHLFPGELLALTLLPGLELIFNEDVAPTAVILAGPEKELREGMKQIPLLEGHFEHEYIFEDYSPEDMMSIFFKLAQEEGYIVDDTCMSALLREMHQLWSKKEEKSNRQKVKEYFQIVQMVQSQRCVNLPKHKRSKEALMTIMPEDLTWKGEDPPSSLGNKEWRQKIKRITSSPDSKNK